MNETELLFSRILNCDRLSLYLNKDLLLDKDRCSLAAEALKRRINAEPIQYILGKTEFMGMEFKVDADVLIPRPETEILVETVIKYAANIRQQAAPLNLLDIGTGSGCIGVSLAKFIPDASVTAVDISEKAIRVARRNAFLNGVKINFLVSDLFSNKKLKIASAMPGGGDFGGSYDLIVSNPPYIPTGDIKDLQPEIGYEPRIALDGGLDGLVFYRNIAGVVPFYLSENSFLVMEIGFNQRKEIENIFKKSGNFEIIEVVRDYNNIDRVMIIRKIMKNG